MPNETIIQLIGNMRENVEELINAVNCRCGMKSHLRAIFNIYCDKIEKLREERNYYREQSYLMAEELNKKRNGEFDLSNFEGKRLSSVEDEGSQNIFTILCQMKNEMELPFSISMDKMAESPRCLDKSVKMIQFEGLDNPEDSLLLTQESRINFTPNSSKQKPKRTFEQFLQDKVEENHALTKIREDMENLDNKKYSRTCPDRKPLGDRMQQVNNRLNYF